MKKILFLLLIISKAYGQQIIVKTLNDSTFDESWKKIDLSVKDGKDGKDGVNGTNGLPGVNGLPGKDGKDGLTGATGPTGAQGPIGLTGLVGIQGPMGPVGLKGETGATGATGPQGPQGIQGPPGTSTVIGIGSGFATSIKSVLDFGANGNGQVDNSNAFDSAVKYCINNGVRTLYIPLGRFRITRPWNIKKGNAFVTLNIMGESSWWDATGGSTIFADFTNNCAINIQRGKGCTIKNLQVVGKFQPPNVNADQFYNLTFEQFNDGICATNRNAPYAGIAIDYFDNADGGVGGSSGCVIENCEITNFYVGVITSANSHTLNAENLTFRFLNFQNVNTCIAGCQAQEKMNTVYKINNWGTCFQTFDIGAHFGAGNGGNWNISDVNIAGLNVQFGHIEMAGWNSSSFAHIFAETLGRLGYVHCGGTTISFTDMHIDFNYPDIAGLDEVITTSGAGVSFTNCVFRYYGLWLPLRIQSNALYNHCTFGWQPYNTNHISVPIFNNCWYGGYGTFEKCLKTANIDPIYNGGENLQNVTVINHSFIFTATKPENYYVNGFVSMELGNPVGYGIVTAISGNKVTVCCASKEVVSGNYFVRAYKLSECTDFILR